MATPQTSLGAAPGRAYAGFGSRLAAYTIDAIIALAILFAVGFTLRFMRVAGLWSQHGGMEPPELWMSLSIGAKLLVMSTFVVSSGPFYLILMEASPWQASFGKRWLNIYVTDDAGQRISLLRSFGRWVGKYCFGWFGGSLVSLVTVLVTADHKALHDMTASTLVLSGRPTTEESLEPWRVFAVFALPFFWMLLTFYITLG